LRVTELIATWRSRLHDLSWFMRCLNESVARMANREDRCTGRFWEGRFKSQALLDERALLVCMACVDLNPIRAAMAHTPEHSEFPSIKERIEDPAAPALRPFSGRADDTHGIPYRFVDYLELVDWAGRAIHAHQKGFIPPDLPPILQRLRISRVKHLLPDLNGYRADISLRSVVRGDARLASIIGSLEAGRTDAAHESGGIVHSTMMRAHPGMRRPCQSWRSAFIGMGISDVPQVVAFIVLHHSFAENGVNGRNQVDRYFNPGIPQFRQAPTELKAC